MMAGIDIEASSGQALPPGTRLEEFTVERVLGSGGFGVTYLARDGRLGRRVVIKENLPVQFCYRDTHSMTVAPRNSRGEDAENFRWSLENFSREASLLAAVDHPGIVRVLRSFECFNTAYFVMPFVEGVSLDEVISSRFSKGKGGLGADEADRILRMVLDALAYLHAHGIYHRDIKPANILIAENGNPVLIDFGSARQLLGEKSMTVVESAGYTPFEQLQSKGKVGPWSDLYALGATMAKALAGECPPKATDRVMDDPWIPFSRRPAFKGRYPAVMLAGIDRAMAGAIRDRWQDAGSWLKALDGAAVNPAPASYTKTRISGPEIPLPQSQGGAGGAERKRPNHGLRVAFAGLAALVAGGIAFVVANHHDKSDSDGDVPVHGLIGPPGAVSSTLVVSSDPSGATLYDSKGGKLGTTPVTLKNIASGTWGGRLELAGYQSAEVTERVVGGDINVGNPVKLKPVPQTVYVSSTPSGAEIVENGAVIGTTPWASSSMDVGTPVAYTVRKQGYTSATASGQVPLGKRLELSVELAKSDSSFAQWKEEQRQAEAERVEAERAAREKANKEQAAREQAEKDRQAKQKQEQEEAAKKGDDNINPFYQKLTQGVMTDSDFSSWTKSELQTGINYLFARNGYAFEGSKANAVEARKVFGGMTWYRPRPGWTMEQIEAGMSYTDVTNMKTMARVRDSR